MMTLDMHVVEDLSVFLFVNGTSVPGHDLIARNIQRGRDHGLPGYNEYRRFCGMSPACSWQNRPQEIPDATWQLFMTIYDKPADIDLFSGGLAEVKHKSSMLGRTFTCLIGKQFFNLKYGDRFFYTHRGPTVPFPFNDQQLAAISSRGLGDVICDNTQIPKITQNPFLAGGEPVQCGQHQKLDIQLFADEQQDQKKS